MFNNFSAAHLWHSVNPMMSFSCVTYVVWGNIQKFSLGIKWVPFLFVWQGLFDWWGLFVSDTSYIQFLFHINVSRGQFYRTESRLLFVFHIILSHFVTVAWLFQVASCISWPLLTTVDWFMTCNIDGYHLLKQCMEVMLVLIRTGLHSIPYVMKVTEWASVLKWSLFSFWFTIYLYFVISDKMSGWYLKGSRMKSWIHLSWLSVLGLFSCFPSRYQYNINK